MSNNSNSRTRTFACVVYEDSAPKNWQFILREQLVPAFISPYHDKDINPTGEPKKAHWHVLLMFEGVKTKEQAKLVFDKIGGVMDPSPVNSIRGYARYLCHLDNPDKAQYSTEAVQSLCGADYNHTIGLAFDKYRAIAEMIDYIQENKVFYYCDLMSYARMERFDWFRVLCDCGSYVVSNYIKDNRVRYDELCKP